MQNNFCYDYLKIVDNFYYLKHEFDLDNNNITITHYNKYLNWLVKTFGKNFYVFEFIEDNQEINIYKYSIVGNKRYVLSFSVDSYDVDSYTEENAEDFDSFLSNIIHKLHNEQGYPVLLKQNTLKI